MDRSPKSDLTRGFPPASEPFAVTLKSSVPLPVRPSAFCTLMSNFVIRAVSAMSMLATSSVGLTNEVDLTEMPPGSFVPVTKNHETAPRLKPLPLIVTLRLTVPWGAEEGSAELAWRSCATAGAGTPAEARKSNRQPTRPADVAVDFIHSPPCFHEPRVAITPHHIRKRPLLGSEGHLYSSTVTVSMTGMWKLPWSVQTNRPLVGALDSLPTAGARTSISQVFWSMRYAVARVVSE